LSAFFNYLNLQTSIRTKSGLFTTGTGLGRKNWRGGFRVIGWGRRLRW